MSLKGSPASTSAPSFGVIGICHHAWLLIWMLGISAHIFMLGGQALYRLSHHLSPCVFLILAFYHVLSGKDVCVFVPF